MKVVFARVFPLRLSAVFDRGKRRFGALIVRGACVAFRFEGGSSQGGFVAPVSTEFASTFTLAGKVRPHAKTMRERGQNRVRGRQNVLPPRRTLVMPFGE